ncbi:hypothetical protein BV25DRAFT_1831095, partial [Artomyces pyxidatus]
MNALYPQDSYDDLLATLRDLPQLESLHLGDDILPDFTDFDVHPRVPLLNLKSLTLSGTVGMIALFLRSVDILPSCELELLCDDITGLEDVEDGEVDALVASLQTLYSPAVEAAASFGQLLIVDKPDDYYVCLRISATEPSSPMQLPNCLCLDVMSQESPSAFTSQLLSTLPLIGGIKTLTLVHVTFLGPQEWQRIGPAMTDVENLLLKCDAGMAQGICEALYTALWGTPTVFPRLRNLVVMLRSDSRFVLTETQFVRMRQGSPMTVIYRAWT